MAFNSVGSYNNSFIGNSTAKPICGQFLRDIYKNNLYQAQVSTSETLVPGASVILTNTNSESGAGLDLNPNVLTITGENTDVTSGIKALLLESPTDVLADDATAATPVEGQIVNVAIIGSGVEVYMPCDADMVGYTIGNPVYWDVTTKTLKATAVDTAPEFKGAVLSPVVDGITYVIEDSIAKFSSTKCVKVRL